jgi:hypothetical protein
MQKLQPLPPLANLPLLHLLLRMQKNLQTPLTKLAQRPWQLNPSSMQKNRPLAQHLPQQELQMMLQQLKLPRLKGHPVLLRNFGLSALMNKTRRSAALAHSAGYSNVPSNAR